MTSYPTILGTGGHTSGGPYEESTHYTNVGLGRNIMIQGGVTGQEGFLNELYVRQEVRAAGTISELSWGLFKELDAALTFRLRQNGSNTGLSVSFGGDGSGWMTDSTHSVAVAIGDWLDFAADIGGDTVNNDDFYCASARFDGPSTSPPVSAQMLVTQGPQEIDAPTGTVYGSLLGILGDSTDEGQEKFSALTSGTWKRMACFVKSNTLDASTTVTNCIHDGSSVTGSMTIVVPASAAAANYEDTTHSDSVTAGNLLDYALSTSADSGALGMFWVGCHYLPSPASHCMIGGTPAWDTSTNVIGPPGVVTYWYSSLFGGGNIMGDIPRATGMFPYAASVTNYSNLLSSAGATGAATFTLLVNGVSSLAASSGLNQTGWFTDGLADTVSAGDFCTNQVVWSGQTGMDDTVTWNGASLLVVAS